MAPEGDFLDLLIVGCTLLISGVPKVFWVVYVFINELEVVLYFRSRDLRGYQVAKSSLLTLVCI